LASTLAGGRIGALGQQLSGVVARLARVAERDGRIPPERQFLVPPPEPVRHAPELGPVRLHQQAQAAAVTLLIWRRLRLRGPAFGVGQL